MKPVKRLLSKCRTRAEIARAAHSRYRSEREEEISVSSSDTAACEISDLIATFQSLENKNWLMEQELARLRGGDISNKADGGSGSSRGSVWLIVAASAFFVAFF